MKNAFIVLFFIAFVGGTFVSGYFLGKAHRQIEYIEKKVEVIKYVEKNKAVIAAKPNAGRADILKLMRAGDL